MSKVEKGYAVMARSRFSSENAQNTPFSDHFWKLRCRKSVRRCGAKQIVKSKCTKHIILGPLLEVEMSKKCMPLCREADFEVKMCKTPVHVLDCFWRFRLQMDRQTDRYKQSNSQRDSQRNRWRDRQTDTQTQTDSEIPRQIDKERKRDRKAETLNHHCEVEITLACKGLGGEV